MQNLQTGDVVLVNTVKGKTKFRTFLTKAIRWFEDSPWNHAAIVVVIDDVVYISEADKYGVGFAPLTSYSDHPEKYELGFLRYRYNMSKDDQYKLKHFCIEFSNNVPYGFVNLILYQSIRFLSKKLLGREIWIGEKSKKKALASMICGKWVAYCYNQLKGDFEDWPKVAPVDIYLSPAFIDIL